MALSTTITSSNSENFAQLKCQHSTLICKEKTVILGCVTIGADCVVHPTANIIAKNGPIIMGNSNLIEERVNIINNQTGPMIIGNHNVFEVDSHCEAPQIGNHNILESKSYVGDKVILTNNCVIGAGCVISDNKSSEQKKQSSEEDDNGEERLSPYTVISGKNLNRRVVSDFGSSSHTSQMDFLRKILPNYQKLWRPGTLPATPIQK